MFAQLKALQKKGFITRTSKARSIALSRKVSILEKRKPPVVEVPLAYRMRPGLPVDAPENCKGSVTCDAAFLKGDISRLFALRITGDAMRDLGILDGDVVIVRQTHNIRRGDIVVAFVDNKTIVRSYYPARDLRIELRPANPDFESQLHPVENVTIQGKVIGLQRQY